MVLFASGLHIAWGIWKTIHIGPWLVNSRVSQGTFVFTMLSWYLAALVGNFIGAVIVKLIRKSYTYVSVFFLYQKLFPIK